MSGLLYLTKTKIKTIKHVCYLKSFLKYIFLSKMCILRLDVFASAHMLRSYSVSAEWASKSQRETWKLWSTGWWRAWSLCVYSSQGKESAAVCFSVAAQKQDWRKSQLHINTPDKKIFNMGRNMVRISQQLCTEQSASVSVSKDPKEICNTARAKCFLSSISIGLFVFPNLLLHSLSSF